MDPITDIFRTLRVTALVHSRLEATAPWGLKRAANEADARIVPARDGNISPYDIAHFGMISRGNCWLSVESVEDAIPLAGGDCFLVAPGRAYMLRDDLRSPAVTFCQLARERNSNVIHYGGGGTPTTIISGLLTFDRASLKSMTQLLPPLMVMKGDEPRTLALHATLQMLASELAAEAPGSQIVADRISEVLVIQVLRAYIGSNCGSCRTGWLRAIFDPQIGAALRSIHENVNHGWTVESLASTAGMSRSAFAARFKELVAQTPLDYVTEWRMQRALQLLRERDAKLADVARSVGYDSDAAFSKAFKRLVGLNPGEYRKAGDALNLTH